MVYAWWHLSPAPLAAEVLSIYRSIKHILTLTQGAGLYTPIRLPCSYASHTHPWRTRHWPGDLTTTPAPITHLAFWYQAHMAASLAAGPGRSGGIWESGGSVELTTHLPPGSRVLPGGVGTLGAGPARSMPMLTPKSTLMSTPCARGEQGPGGSAPKRVCWVGLHTSWCGAVAWAAHIPPSALQLTIAMCAGSTRVRPTAARCVAIDHTSFRAVADVMCDTWCGYCPASAVPHLAVWEGGGIISHSGHVPSIGLELEGPHHHSHPTPVLHE